MTKKKLEVIILSSNRPYFLIESIKSVLPAVHRCRKILDCEIIVSDNSDNENCIDAVESSKIKKLITIRKRRPKKNIYEHFETVINEALSDYIIIFHDDDIMLPNLIEDLYLIIDSNPECVAVGSNAVKIDEIGNRYQKMWQPRLVNNHYKCMSADSIIQAYFSYSSKGICPFPGYIYRTKLIKNKSLNKEKGGKHSDVSFLYDLTKNGQIIWSNKVCMEYRVHKNNDSAFINITDQLSLLRYLKRENRNNDDLKNFRFRIWLNWLINKNNLNLFKINRHKIIIKFIIYYLIFNLLLNYNFLQYAYRKYKNSLKK